ncbi:MAG: dihydrolipoamide acetyltransferase family protein [Candidatus Diapherotrites archaeon]|nr:dihydrolipoamide acetyltransferase family protein [Candidatus Diapherotrites archaeon]
MVYEFKFPDVGEGIHEGTLLKWMVQEGDSIKEDQPLAEVETDKAVVEIPSPKTGTILKLHAKAGEIITVGNVIVTFGETGEKVPTTPAQSQVHVQSQPIKQTAPMPVQQAQSTVSIGRILATPATRKLARELNVNLENIQGTGPGGRITDEDVANAANEKPVTKTSVPTSTTMTAHTQPAREMKAVAIKTEGTVERIPFKGVRKAVADHMIQSVYTAPQVTHLDECDVTDLVILRERQKADAEKRGVKLTFLPFIIKSLVASLKDHTFLNASVDDTTKEIVLKKYYNIGIAVDTAEGLMVFVLKDADKKSILQLAKEIQEKATLARERKLKPEDMHGGTFTITNIGSAGGIMATPVLNYPEVGILGIYKIVDRAVVRNSEIVVRKMMNLTVTFDHRIIDGAEAARFLNDVIKYLQDPGLMLVDVI